jgi:hypothetical protein
LKKHNYTLDLTFRCGEDWSAMHDQPGGKFCGSCSKSVIDLTKLSDQQIIRLIESNRNGFCGRLTATQLQKTYVPIENVSVSLDLIKVIAGLTLLMTFDGNEMTAQPLYSETNLKPVPQTELNLLNPVKKESIATDSLGCYIKGVVRDSLTNEPIPGAVIIIKDHQLGVQAEMDGSFFLEIPDNLRTDFILLEVTMIGYESFEVILTTQQLPLVKDIYMVQSEENLRFAVGVITARPNIDPIEPMKITKRELRRMKK